MTRNPKSISREAKRLMKAIAESRRTWNELCDAIGVPQDSKFVIFDEGPQELRDAHGNAMRELFAARKSFAGGAR